MPEPQLSEKRWKFVLEKELFSKWQSEKLFDKPQKTEGHVFVIDTPPPYPSGRWHVGGALHYCQIDMIARYLRMSRKNVWFPIGIDRNGLPIESRVEKDFGVKAHEIPRNKFLNLCHQTLDKYEKNISNVMNLTGLSVDWSSVYRTDSPEYRTLTQSTFIDLWNKGLIYEDTKPNNWCPGCKTTLADAEVEYREGKSKLVFIKFPLKNGEYIKIATTRPELLGACQAVVVHPTDSKFSKYAGETAAIPLYDRSVKIIPRPEADPEFGTGALMTCSYGDQEDIRLFRELKLPETIVINEDGKMNAAAGKYEGMTTKDAKEAIIEDLEAGGFIEKIIKIKNKVPICWRSKDDIELIALPEFYLKQMEFVEDIKKLSDEIKFHPPKMKQLLLDWLGAISQDWPISRRRFYGTPVPIFHCKEHGSWVPEKGRYYESWNLELPCPKCGAKSKGDSRVLDTWMDSSVSPLWISNYMKGGDFFKNSFPTFLRPQGKDIVRTWLYYTLLRVYQLTGKKAFTRIWISGHFVDEQGKKMSKSIGNVVYPEPLVERYGADALRFNGA
ncbi:MAG: class I tRNA ligase family protein, partial [Candidatus Altiarchaeota archaeon]|nr:class I tRNA ligase family protein [Candidatus Altiarchaeota archaeon]